VASVSVYNITSN